MRDSCTSQSSFTLFKQTTERERETHTTHLYYCAALLIDMHFVTTFLTLYNLVLNHVIVMLLIETAMMNADKIMRGQLHDIGIHEPESTTRYHDTISFTGCIKHRQYQLREVRGSNRYTFFIFSLGPSFYSSVPPGKY